MAEVFPGEEYVSQAAFLFTEDGELAYILLNEPENPEDPSPAMFVYKMNVIDSVIDESLFDLSGYDISKGN